LLGEDLAMVGTNETTATINYFRYGTPEPQRPIRCHWRGGQVTDESRAFLDGLQGKDIETLRRADGIDYLDYFLPLAFLKQVTLVDTPGTEAVVSEHQHRTAEYLRLSGQLRERQASETRHLSHNADAVIYLVGEVGKANDQALLDEFTKVAGGDARALNAIGVMARIDLQLEIIDRRVELSQKIARQLQDSLNTVVPVSAMIYREHGRLTAAGGGGLVKLIETLERIPAARLTMLLKNPKFFRDYDFTDCPVTKEERRALLGETDWAVFTAIAREAARPGADVGAVAARLKEIAGFEPLREILKRHFMERGHILRCHRIIRDVKAVLDEIRFTRLRHLRDRSHEEKCRLERFLGVIPLAGCDVRAARELENFLREKLDTSGEVRRLEALWEELDEMRSGLAHELNEHNADFEALQLLEADDRTFSAPELDELRALFGRYGLGVQDRIAVSESRREYVRERQLAWGLARSEARIGSVRRAVAERAFTRYGLILEELSAS
ncbi:MAG TPA: hypothetical protein VEX60_05410, partial [Pyrinomonadaceae bacterium]|nr:hypothetical protein [Pyrinomonadaceae bacterium]